jgi:hypothetical protein
MRSDERSFIRISGGIITSHFAVLLQDEEHGFEYARPETFIRPWYEEDTPPQNERDFLANVRGAWDRLVRRFDEKYRDVKAGRLNADDVRRLWQRPILEELGFELTSSSRQIVISDRIRYKFSHRGWFTKAGIPRPPVIHILPVGTNPNVRPSRTEPSPHDALQDCLNRHDDTWAVLMNEAVIRLLRDYHHTTVPGYIEFDLEGIFLNRSFPEFLALYRFCHVSRFARNKETGKEPLEDYYEVSRQAGEKIGEDLRENVVRAIEELGNGFLDSALLERLRGNNDACQAYYQEILTVVYRIIFMLFAEQRGMLGSGEHGDLFLEEYSITSLRERVDAFVGRDDRHTDLWEGLSVTFEMLEEGVPVMGVNAFDGLLFSRANEVYLKYAKCRNTALMNAIRSLTWTKPQVEGRGRQQRIYGVQRISYADLSVEEIGAIYESLLEYAPRITDKFEEFESREYRPSEFMLDPRGSERKSTGSYYTNPDLIAELITSALDPVIANRLSQAGTDLAAREKALLSIRVCDPACGSGAFLIAAANRLGHELAKIRTKTELPSYTDVHKARRDVLSHCIYGVDLNPMAVELAKVSLWINSLVSDKPLSFLNYHIKYGNSLIGTTPGLIDHGVPDEAYSPAEGDNREVASEVKKANKDQRRNQTFAYFGERTGLADKCAERFAALAEDREDTPEEVETKKAEYERLRASMEYNKEKWTADCWTAAFFWPLLKGELEWIPTTETVRMVKAQGINAVPDDVRQHIAALSEKFRFFHWHLEFPEVMQNGGFDCILGNPPWRKVKILDVEFFATRDEKIANAESSAERKRLIKNIESSNPKLFSDYLNAQKNSEKLLKFLSHSMNFPFTGRGEINSYALFVELFQKIININGYAGIITQTGILTYETYQDYIRFLIENQRIVSVYDFINKRKIFKEVQTNIKFSLVTIKGSKCSKLMIACHLEKPEELLERNRIYEIDSIDIFKVNPNTYTLPMFRTKKDANLIVPIYRKIPILSPKIQNNEDSWEIQFFTLFHMTNDRTLFKFKEELEEIGAKLQGNIFQDEKNTYLPLYESKITRQYDHRSATFLGIPLEQRFKIHAGTNKRSINDQNNPFWVPIPRYWIKSSDLSQKLTVKWNYNWLIGFRNAISATADARSVTFCIIPKYGVGHSMPLISSKRPLGYILALIGNFNSFILDYIVRQKVSGGNLTFYIVEQLPILPPSKYTKNVLQAIESRIIELVYTAWDLEPFANDVLDEMGVDQWNELFPNNKIRSDGKVIPFKWDEERRFDLRCDLDALYFHLYEISRDDVDYIMETFPIVKRKDEAEYGTFRTKDVILAKYDTLAREFVKVMRADLPRKNGGIDWKAVITGGENEKVEFKSSISWDVQTKQRNKALEHTIAKTIASFMNTHGGVLLIGVNDAGKVEGLAGDLKLAKGQNEDGLRLKLDDLVRDYLTNKFLPLIKVNSLKEDQKLYWAVEVRPAGEPVYVKQNNDEEFWIRGTSSSRKLSLRESIEYIKSHFNNAK